MPRREHIRYRRFGNEQNQSCVGSVGGCEFGAPYDRHPSLERDYIYTHAWQQVKDKFYDKDIHGIDWNGYGESTTVGSCRISTTIPTSPSCSASFWAKQCLIPVREQLRQRRSPLATSELGAYFDFAYDGDGTKIAEVLPRGLSTKAADVRPGDIILAIDGEPVKAGADYYPMLDGKAGRKVRLTVKRPMAPVAHLVVKPVSGVGGIIYQLWVERNEALVDSLSGGRIAYVHIKGMDGESFRAVYSKAVGQIP